VDLYARLRQNQSSRHPSSRPWSGRSAPPTSARGANPKASATRGPSCAVCGVSKPARRRFRSTPGQS